MASVMQPFKYNSLMTLLLVRHGAAGRIRTCAGGNPLEVLQPLVGYKKPVRVHFHISQLTSKFIIMNYLRLLLFFFAMLAPLQLTSAGCVDNCMWRKRHLRTFRWVKMQQCERKCLHGKWKQIGKLCDDHTLTMTTAITTAMTMATTKKLHQDFPKIILCDFRVSFVSQINWQPIGKLLFMINL